MTAQIGERLLYDGREMSMSTLPLDDYFALAGVSPDFGYEQCTAMWRGYVGSWTVLGDRLYLVAIHNLASDGADTNFLETIFPGHPDSVFADWYTGTLCIPQGEILKYVHMGYLSTFERDMLIDVERGVIGEVRIREYDIPSLGGAQNV